MQMDMKQKTLLVVTIAAFGYLGYQIYGLIKSDMKSPSLATQPTVRSVSSRQLAHSSSGPVAVANAAEMPSVSQQLTPQPTTMHHKPLLTEQKAYLNLVNQYELAKMKRRLLEEKAAIAAAQHRIATLNQQTHEIDSTLAGSQPVYDDINTNASPRDAVYQLSYVDYQNGAWSATLNKNGRYYQVHEGSQLTNGSKIISIDRDGIILKNANKRERITFDGVVLLPAQKAEAPHPTKKQSTTSKNRNVSDIYAAARKALTTASILKHENVVTHTPVSKKMKTKTAHVKKTLLKTLKVKKEKPTLKIIKAVATKPAKKTTAVKPIIQKPKPIKKSLAIKSTPHPVKIHYTEDERRILSMPKKSYTIQLIGSYHRDIVENFAIANDLGNRAMQFYVLNRGKRWYVLLYGSYPTRHAAQRALNNLPPDLTPEEPWVREVSAVQRDIRHHKHVSLKKLS